MRILILDKEDLASDSLSQKTSDAGVSSKIVQVADQDLLCLQTRNPGKAFVGLEFPSLPNEIAVVFRVNSEGQVRPIVLGGHRESLHRGRVSATLRAVQEQLTSVLAPDGAKRRLPQHRDAGPDGVKQLRFGNLVLDLGSRLASIGREELTLTASEWLILAELTRSAPDVITKEQLMHQLCLENDTISPNAIEVHVSRLRRKLSIHGISVRASRGVGYGLRQQAAS